jgi:predicted secreted Zn-dependent protease
MRAAGVAALTLFAAGAARADRNDFSLEYFTITGDTSRELSAQIDQKGPLGDNGRRSDGYTRWFINWRFDLRTDAIGCSARNIVVDVEIRMTLPQWKPPRSADPALVARWNQYLTALRIHEDGQRCRAEAAAGDVRRALQRERGASDCRTVENRLNARANALLDELRARQDAYDRDTASGRKQGVRRP